MSGMLAAVGFKNIRREWWGERFQLTPEEFWDVQAVFDSEARERLTALPDVEVEKLKRKFVSECKVLADRGASLVYRTGAIIYSAER